MKNALTFSALALLAAGATNIGCRPHNDDSFLVRERLVVVADGMGGHQAGGIAATTTTDVFADMAGAERCSDENAVKMMLYDTARRAHTRIVSGQGTPGCEGMGTTVVAAAYFRTRLHIAHCGDSRAYLLRHGQLCGLTEDHTLVKELVNAKLITPEAAETHRQRNVITRYLGDENAERATPEYRAISPQRGDVILLCSDGLHGAVSDDEIAAVLKKATRNNMVTGGCRCYLERTRLLKSPTMKARSIC